MKLVTDVRAVFRVFPVSTQTPPYDRIQAKIFYPGEASHSKEENDTGLIPVTKTDNPMPVVILMPGMNVGPESYQWLALRLASQHYIVVTFSYFAEELPGYVTLSPGINVNALRPENFGKEPSASILPALIDGIKHEAETPFFKDSIDTNTIVLGGHSAGGSIAMLNNQPAWFDGVQAAFAYGAHAAAATLLGYAENSYYTLPTSAPLLLLGGTLDGVINASHARYSRDKNRENKLIHTFQHAFDRNQQDSFLALIEGANHFTFAHPMDTSTGRHFLDHAETNHGKILRHIIADLITDFIELHARKDSHAGDRLQTRLEADNLIAFHDCK